MNNSPANAIAISDADLRMAHRLLDANFNRAMEAFRTLEDIARFSDNATDQARYKVLRHRLQQASQSWDSSQLLLARDAEFDVGKENKTTAELDRSEGCSAIAHAAVQRSQQALRCIEEFAKWVFPASAAAIEAVRYQCYDVNASLLLKLTRDDGFLTRAQLYVLVDCNLPIEHYADRIKAISEAGVDIIQIRDKTADADKLIEYAATTLRAMESTGARLIVNDRVDVARVAHAWGVHVGQTDLTVKQSRSMLKANQVVGVSTHDLAQIDRAIQDGADYIGCGPTFPSRTKQFESFSGLEFLQNASKHIHGQSMPAFAIGGIDSENLAKVIDAGFTKVAVSSAIWNADQPSKVADAMKSILVRNRG